MLGLLCFACLCQLALWQVAVWLILFAKYCLPDIVCQTDIVCQILFANGLRCAKLMCLSYYLGCRSTPVWGPEGIMETNLKLYDAHNGTCKMGACLQHCKLSVDAMQCRHDDTGQLYYNLEYTVKSPQFFRHNVSVYAARCASASWRKCRSIITV